MEEMVEFLTRPTSGKPAIKKYVTAEQFKKQLKLYKAQKRISQIIAMTTRPLGCVIVEYERNGNGMWIEHRRGVYYDWFLNYRPGDPKPAQIQAEQDK